MSSIAASTLPSVVGRRRWSGIGNSPPQLVAGRASPLDRFVGQFRAWQVAVRRGERRFLRCSCQCRAHALPSQAGHDPSAMRTIASCRGCTTTASNVMPDDQDDYLAEAQMGRSRPGGREADPLVQPDGRPPGPPAHTSTSRNSAAA